MPGKVAIIGGGSSGVTSIKSMVDAGFTDVVCFERREVIGGLWYFNPDPARWVDEACVNRATVINTSKEFMTFSDYPMPDNCPNFCHNTDVESYFLDYVRHFGLERYIRFNSEVLTLTKHSTFEKTGKWDIKSRDTKTGKEITEVYDFVIIANGHHGKPNRPKFPGQELYKGKTMHSKEFKDVIGFEGKRALTIGIGNSGGDITAELSKYCQVFLSTRRGVWILNRLGESGMPWDTTFHTRYRLWFHNITPRFISNYLWESVLSKQMDHAMYGLRPVNPPSATHPTVNDELPNRIACGRVKVRPNVRRFTETGVEFVDGSFEDNIDLVVFCTGYSVSYPFLDGALLGNVAKNELRLYKHMWVPELPKQTLALVGCCQPLGSVFPMAELQSRLAAEVFKGAVKLPSSEEMKRDYERREAAIRRRYVDTPRHTFQVDWLPYLDEIAEAAGCKPNLLWLFFTDPVLWKACVFGPGAPYQYRIHGPNAWSGARHAMLTVMDRILKPFEVRGIPKRDRENQFFVWTNRFVKLSIVGGLAYYGLKSVAKDGDVREYLMEQITTYIPQLK